MMTRYVIAFLFCFAIGNAQTITFRGCQALFENQDYTFNRDAAADATGRYSYTTTPVTGDQHCGGVGTCEFRVIWNAGSSRWEFLADSGSGGFSQTFLIYYNASASLPNPPSLSLGSWVENIPTTQSLCGGNLSTANAVMTGSVQNTLLGNADFDKKAIKVFPNPAGETLTVTLGDVTEGRISILNNLGQVVVSQPMSGESINVSGLKAGIYIIRLDADSRSYVSKFVKL